MPRVLAYPAPPLTAGRIVLRPWQEGDLVVVAEASRDPYIPQITTVPAPYSDEAGLAWIARQGERVAAGVGLPFCVADAATDRARGFCALWLDERHRARARCGYWLAPSARGHGLAVTALTLVADWAFASCGIVRLELLIEPQNAASRRVAERAGFVPAAGMRELHGRALSRFVRAAPHRKVWRPAAPGRV
jgi:ribosomal-protein-alanine N-acetyltransferase